MTRKPLWLLAALVATFLAYGALNRPDAAQPALWQVDGPNGQRAWLLGTIHALPRPAAWQGGKVGKALEASDRIVVEVAALGDGAATAQAFEAVAHTPTLPPLDQRLAPDQRPALMAALARTGRAMADFGATETWAAALMLAKSEDAGDPANGIDRAVLAARGARPVEELEGAARQFAIFDQLPEAAQRRLLTEAIAVQSGNPEDLAIAWRKGDIAAIAAETRKGMLADPVLREALNTGRNRAWAARISAMMAQGGKPFVAVGTAHLAGDDSLPAMLAARGYRVTRVQ